MIYLQNGNLLEHWNILFTSNVFSLCVAIFFLVCVGLLPISRLFSLTFIHEVGDPVMNFHRNSFLCLLSACACVLVHQLASPLVAFMEFETPAAYPHTDKDRRWKFNFCGLNKGRSREDVWVSNAMDNIMIIWFYLIEWND